MRVMCLAKPGDRPGNRRGFLKTGAEYLVGYMEGEPGGHLGFAVLEPDKPFIVTGLVQLPFRVTDLQSPKGWVFAIGPDGVLRCGPPDVATQPGLFQAMHNKKATVARQKADSIARRERYREPTTAITEMIIAWPQSKNAHEAGLLASRSIAMNLVAGNAEPELAASKLRSIVQQIPTLTPYLEPFLEHVDVRVRGESRHERTARLKDAAYHLSSTLHDAEQGPTPHAIDQSRDPRRTVEHDPGSALDR